MTASRVILALLALGFLGLQYRLWVGEGSLAEVSQLRSEIAEQQAELERLHARNRTLRAEVDDLKQGLRAIEARARNDLGMIREGETFFQLVEPREQAP